jgi:succinate dehydrogenase / fumarate reductase cytochrome b subunit
MYCLQNALANGETMRRVTNIYSSSVGKKVLMAVTGVIFVLFVIGHMYGNLKAFYGPEAFNHYAEFLREMGSPLFMHGQLLWIVRIVLIVAVIFHVLLALQLWLLSNRARPVKYSRGLEIEETTIGARTMRWGGLLLFVFVILHLLHLTVGSLHPSFIPGDAYNNLVVGFQWWPVPVGYILVMGALCLHLYHGVWSSMQTLGISHQRFNRYRRPVAVIVALVVFFGFVATPVGVMAGVLTLT